jgi:hypothetical protein
MQLPAGYVGSGREIVEIDAGRSLKTADSCDSLADLIGAGEGI